MADAVHGPVAPRRALCLGRESVAVGRHAGAARSPPRASIEWTFTIGCVSFAWWNNARHGFLLPMAFSFGTEHSVLVVLAGDCFASTVAVHAIPDATTLGACRIALVDIARRRNAQGRVTIPRALGFHAVLSVIDLTRFVHAFGVIPQASVGAAVSLGLEVLAREDDAALSPCAVGQCVVIPVTLLRCTLRHRRMHRTWNRDALCVLHVPPTAVLGAVGHVSVGTAWRTLALGAVHVPPAAADGAVCVVHKVIAWDFVARHCRSVPPAVLCWALRHLHVTATGLVETLHLRCVPPAAAGVAVVHAVVLLAWSWLAAHVGPDTALGCLSAVVGVVEGVAGLGLAHGR